MTEWLQAGLWGLAGGATLVVGAAIAWFLRVPPRVVATVMAFGAGVLISALAFELVQEATESGGLWAAAGGFVTGALVYLAATLALDRFGARHRKRSGDQQTPAEQQGSGLAIAVGALLDGIPESIVLGLSLVGGNGVSTVVFAAVAISNLPEGLSSAAGMKRAGRSAAYVFGVWGGIALASGLAALLGSLALQSAPPETIGFITTIAAGAILTMLADTMIPEAFEKAHAFTGVVTAAGFLVAFVLHSVGG